MGVNISGKGVLSGLATLVAGVVNNFNLLVTKLIGYTHIQVPGGSGYYTTTVTTGMNKYITLNVNGSLAHNSYALFNDGITGPYELRTFPRSGLWTSVASNGQLTIVIDRSSSSNYYLHSSDLITWEEKSFPVSILYALKISYKDNVWTMVAANGIFQATDPLGTWTQVFNSNFDRLDTGSGLPIYDITYANDYIFIGKKYAGSNTINIIASGKNIINSGNWYNGRTIPGNRVTSLQTDNGITYVTNRGYVITMSNNDSPFGTSPSFEPAWTVPNSSTPNPFYQGQSISSAFGKFFWFRSGGSGYYASLLTSVNGIDWTVQLVNGAEEGDTLQGYGDGDLFFDGTRLVFTSGQTFSAVVSSLDGATWGSKTGLPNYSGYSIGQNLTSVYSLKTVQVQTAIGNQGTQGAEILAPIDVYTVSGITETTLDQIKVKNNSSRTITYDLGILDAGVALSDTNALINDQQILAGATATLTTAIQGTITTGKRISVLPSAVDVVEVEVYGNEVKPNVYFAITSYNSDKAAYSKDGINWTAVTMPSSKTWKSIKYGNGKFVAISNGSTVAYSSNGIDWTETSMPYQFNWESLAYGNGKFVAVAYHSGPTSEYVSNAAYSTDGVNWSISTLPFPGTFRQVIYADGKFVTTGADGQHWNVVYSTDGINWSATSTPEMSNPSISYGNGKFVAVEYNAIHTSTDLVTWTHGSFAQFQGNLRISYGNGKFVVIEGNESQNGLYSTDAVTWTAFTMPSSKSWGPIIYAGGKFVTVGYYYNVGAYSTDGVTWTIFNLPSNGFWNEVTYKSS